MSMQSTRSAYQLVSYADGIAAGMSDAVILVGRVLIALVFVLTASDGSPNAGYLTGLGYVFPEFWSVIAIIAEWVIGITLLFGVGTRYGALLGVLYVVVATVTAHRYWQYPQAQQGIQYIFATKNLAILGGLFVLFVTGAGRYSIDTRLAGRR